MSDHIAHIAICDDTFRLCELDPAIHERFKELMQTHREAAHMGSITRWADNWSADVVAAAREELEGEKQEGSHTRERLAFVLGALTHRSADRHTKPITRPFGGRDGKLPADSEYSSHEAKIYQDVFVFKEVYAGGDAAPAPEASGGLPLDLPRGGPLGHLLDLPADAGTAAFEEHVRVLLRRALISMHTIRPEEQEDIDAWFDRFFDSLQTFPKSIEEYARIFHDWPEHKVKKYLTDNNYYDRKDPIIVLTRRLARGEGGTGDDLAAAMDATSDDSSRYARSLKGAIGYLRAASELYAARIGIDDAKGLLHIGLPELALG